MPSRNRNLLDFFFKGASETLAPGMVRGYERTAREEMAREERQAKQEQARQMMRDRFAMASALEREGPPASQMDVMNFLSQPPEEQAASSADLSMLLADNPLISRQGIPAGQPSLTPGAVSGATSARFREAYQARNLPKAVKKPAARAGESAEAKKSKVLKEADSEARARTSQEIKIDPVAAMDPTQSAAYETRVRTTRAKHKTMLYFQKYRSAFSGRVPSLEEAQSDLQTDFSLAAYQAAKQTQSSPTGAPPAGASAVRGLSVE